MSAPWLSKHNQGRVPHVGVFSTKHMLLFKSNGWQQSSCLYFSEESDIPTSILDGSAWTSSNCSEGRSIVNRLNTSVPDTECSNQFQHKIEPMSAEWWSTWNNGRRVLQEILELFEKGDEAMEWSPAKLWEKKARDRNYQYLCQYYVVIHLQKMDISQKFISAPLRAVKILSDERVPPDFKHFTIVELSKNEEFIEIIKI